MFLIIFCIVVIVINNLWCMFLLSNAPWYWHIFQDYPPDTITLRYLTSWLGRLLCMIAAVGMCRLENWARKFMILLLFINILSIPWKHPPQGIARGLEINHNAQQFYTLMEQSPFRNIDAITLSNAVLNIWDLLFNATLIFILTRTIVKRKFH